MSSEEKLEKLAAKLTQHGAQATCKQGRVEILQDIDGVGYCIYEIIPWRADPHVPVLYCTLYQVDDVANSIKPATASEFKSSGLPQSEYFARWISATEHPLTGLPTVFLHPCQTRDWLQENNDDWWLWTQYFGQAIGLSLTLDESGFN